MMTVTHDLNKISELLTNVTGPKADKLFDDILRTSADYMVRETKKRFVQQRGPDGQPWKPLSPVTIRARMQGLGGRATKRSRGRGFAGGHKRLLDTGALMKSIVPRRTSKFEIAVETNVPYAVYQQKGVNARRTERQAWWMIFNLIDPAAAGMKFEDVDNLPPDKRAEARMRILRLVKIKNTLLKRPQVIPATPFMGISDENETGLAKVAAFHVEKFLREAANAG